MRVVRRTIRGTRRAEREVESWAVAGVLAGLLLIAFAITVLTFLVPAVIGGAVWLIGLTTRGDGGLRLRRQGAHIARWPWRRLSRAIYGR